ncbi:lysophospholipid acyltransferase family protein [Vulcaniibacterium gelatinicum]|uniref:lysophospholipid acyltransferase family protein n=1 Tax=Vulcaniibacterium gelatinicum TaxID=2598725 RepID=UPI0011CA715C|nr:lysophospholipid acyltransferase family protein [Vulcaniibacterium gelatinicum]
MSSPAADAAYARALRYLLRVPMLLWHVVVHLPLTLLLMLPPWGRIRLDGEPLEYRMVRFWQGGLMHVFGFRLRRFGTPLRGPVVFVANHVSWLDIVALHSQRMMGFVAKREISGWPLVGWLAARGETIFHERGSSESLGGVLHEMLARLRAGRSVGVFPEGRTRDGREVGPFHARIFLAAVEAGVRVQPVALRYGEHGQAQTAVAFRPGESFFHNFLRLLGEPGRTVEVWFLEPIDTATAGGRRQIADLARERIVAVMEGASRPAVHAPAPA